MNLWKKNTAAPIFWLLLLPALLCCNGCDTNPEEKKSEKKRLVDIYIRFLVPENEYKAQIIFLESDSADNVRPVRLTGDVLWNGHPLRIKNPGSMELRYEYLKSGPFTAQQEFMFQDEKGSSRKIAVAMDPISTFSIGPAISRAEGVVLETTGQPLTAGETLLLLFTDEQGNTREISFKGPRKSNTFQLTPQMTGNLLPGKHELYLIKQQQRESVQQQRSVYSLVEWYSAVKAVVVQ